MRASRWLVVSVHDVAPPHWERVQRLLAALDSVGVCRRSLLVIPKFQGRWAIDQHETFCAALRDLQQRGDEMVLHGYEHIGVGTPDGLADRFRNRWFTDGEGEFLSLDYRSARDRIERGLALTKRTSLDVRGFIPPAWLISPEGLRAVRDCGFEYTNSYLTFADLAQGRSCLSPSLVFGPGHVNEDVGVSVQRCLAPLLMGRQAVRVVLHPPCIDHPRRFAQILKMIQTLAMNRQAITYLELLSRLRDNHAGAGNHES